MTKSTLAEAQARSNMARGYGVKVYRTDPVTDKEFLAHIVTATSKYRNSPTLPDLYLKEQQIKQAQILAAGWRNAGWGARIEV